MDHKPIIISKLEIMYKDELTKKEPTSHFKALAYKKVIDEIKKLDHPIYSYKDVEGLSGIGAKISEKIKEIIATGTLQEADQIDQNHLTDEFMKIHGIGPVKANKLIEAGIKSVFELSEAVEFDQTLLNKTQKIGLKYYNTSILRIPRAEMKVHEKILFKFLPEGLTGEIVGSYRRGALDSGDIDMLLTSSSSKEKLLKSFVTVLIENGYILDELASGDKKWMGYVSKNKRGKPRRLDLLLAPPSEYPYSLLYFTGSKEFNVAFRRHANDKGYTINEHKMIPLEEMKVPYPPIMNTEEDIFNFLGLKYVLPEERINFLPFREVIRK